MKKGLKTILWIYSIFMVCDIGTTLLNWNYIPHLESNPIYNLTKSIFPLIVFNIVMFFVIKWTYNSKPTPGNRFFVCNLITWLSLARIIAIYRAIILLINKPLVADVVNLYTETEKASNYSIITISLIFVPVILTQIAFWIFQLDYKMEEK